MKYLVLLVDDGDEKPWDEMTEAEQAGLMEKFGAFDAACAERPGVEILSGEALGPPDTFTTVRTSGGQLQVTDGPYTETVEGLGGFYLVEVPDLDVLLELIKSLPAYDMQLVPALDMGD